jgi:multisubunit Na+/H+ antiporter MnhC subunit
VNSIGSDIGLSRISIFGLKELTKTKTNGITYASDKTNPTTQMMVLTVLVRAFAVKVIFAIIAAPPCAC